MGHKREQQIRLQTGELPPSALRHGRDEMNLAEFPLCSIADRVDPAIKTLRFEDRTFDDSRGEMITRRLTITGSDQYGLPTALDDEVLLGLIQLSKFHEFANRRVPFTRYQLIRLLDWRDESKSYHRLETSLNRWVGVTLVYENAWRSLEERCWVDEKFHILDNVTLYDREKARAKRGNGRHPRLSSFTWNDVIFRSFEAGNLKGIDFDFFRRLQSAIAKRLYRFLDKRFFHRRHWEFNLKELAWEHIGLARNYDVANLKRKLRPAIEELERAGFLTPLGDEDRFRKVSSGDWRIIFDHAHPDRNRGATASRPDEAALALTGALVQRGVTQSAATELVEGFPRDCVRAQLKVFDWLRSRADRRVSLNPAGFLVSSIRDGYTPPNGFVSSEGKARQTAEIAAQKLKQEARRQVQRELEEAAEKAVQSFWSSMSESVRVEHQEEALRHASNFDRRLIERGGLAGSTARQRIFSAYAMKALHTKAGPSLGTITRTPS